MSGRYLPTLPQVTSETLAVVLGAIAGAIIINRLPALKAWLRANYSAPSLVEGSAAPIPAANPSALGFELFPGRK